MSHVLASFCPLHLIPEAFIPCLCIVGYQLHFAKSLQMKETASDQGETVAVIEGLRIRQSYVTSQSL